MRIVEFNEFEHVFSSSPVSGTNVAMCFIRAAEPSELNWAKSGSAARSRHKAPSSDSSIRKIDCFCKHPATAAEALCLGRATAAAIYTCRPTVLESSHRRVEMDLCLARSCTGADVTN